jgi:hypothetical protein
MEYIGFLCFIFAGLSESVMDTLQFHYSNSIFYNFKNKLFWNPEISWKNKYKDGDPTEGPKFLFSTNLLVGLTDAWHLFKLLRTFFIFAGVFFIFINCQTTLMCLIYVIVSRIIFGVSFSLSFDYLFK